jgi:diketogulonate reductase-like aldo/keto reductase
MENPEGAGVPVGWSRREALRMLSAAAAVAILDGPKMTPTPTLRSRAIPSSGELLPVVGLGTWQTFDVGSAAADRVPLEATLGLFARRGGRLVDSSPMYGRSESVVGEIAGKLGLASTLFFATKVWTTGRRAGIEQMEASQRALGAPRLDLEQVHNLVDVATHLPTLRAWKDAGKIRYVGISHYDASAYGEVESVLRREKLDFLQINYSVAEPESGRRLIPLAAERGVAVIANRPFGGGGLLRKSSGRPLPGCAEALGCRSWAPLLLKWILADEAVTCAIPGTARPEHLEENLEAGLGRLPDAAERREISRAAEAFA